MEQILEYINIFSHRYIFRGVPNKDFKLIPSLLREDAVDDYGNYYDEFLNDAINKLNKIIKVDYLNCMEYLQHFNCKTNLLDFSYSFLVALYFACSDYPEEDGKVYVLDVNKYEDYLKEINDLTSKFIVNSENVRKHSIAYNEDGSISIDGCGINLPVVVEPNILFDRIKSQKGLFMLWGSNIHDLNTILKKVNGDKKIYQEIIIKKELKKKLLMLLDEKYSINEISLMVRTEDINIKLEELYSISDYFKYKK